MKKEEKEQKEEEVIEEAISKKEAGVSEEVILKIEVEVSEKAILKTEAGVSEEDFVVCVEIQEVSEVVLKKVVVDVEVMIEEISMIVKIKMDMNFVKEVDSVETQIGANSLMIEKIEVKNSKLLNEVYEVEEELTEVDSEAELNRLEENLSFLKSKMIDLKTHLDKISIALIIAMIDQRENFKMKKTKEEDLLHGSIVVVMKDLYSVVVDLVEDSAVVAIKILNDMKMNVLAVEAEDQENLIKKEKLETQDFKKIVKKDQETLMKENDFPKMNQENLSKEEVTIEVVEVDQIEVVSHLECVQEAEEIIQCVEEVEETSKTEVTVVVDSMVNTEEAREARQEVDTIMIIVQKRKTPKETTSLHQAVKKGNDTTNEFRI